MAVESERRITIELTGDIEAAEVYRAADNTDSPGAVEIKTLASGANTITVPSGGTTPTGVTIIPPAGNASSITLKGVSGDTGIRLHNTDPTSLGLHSSVASFVLTAGAEIEGVRLIWT
jgi:hypothetical protein